MIRELVS